MLFIAHRGLIEGPNKLLENSPIQIQSSLDKGYDCEIDLRVIDNKLYLGHDDPQYHIDHNFLEMPGLWIHCKNFEALIYCKNFQHLNYFWHDTDSYTLTSHGFIWAYPGKVTDNKCIQVMPEMADPTLGNLNFDAYGICSDWIIRIQSSNL